MESVADRLPVTGPRCALWEGSLRCASAPSVNSWTKEMDTGNPWKTSATSGAQPCPAARMDVLEAKQLLGGAHSQLNLLAAAAGERRI